MTVDEYILTWMREHPGRHTAKQIHAGIAAMGLPPSANELVLSELMRLRDDDELTQCDAGWYELAPPKLAEDLGQAVLDFLTRRVDFASSCTSAEVHAAVLAQGHARAHGDVVDALMAHVAAGRVDQFAGYYQLSVIPGTAGLVQACQVLLDHYKERNPTAETVQVREQATKAIAAAMNGVTC